MFHTPAILTEVYLSSHPSLLDSLNQEVESDSCTGGTWLNKAGFAGMMIMSSSLSLPPLNVALDFALMTALLASLPGMQEVTGSIPGTVIHL